MVERLKSAIEKARERRLSTLGEAGPKPPQIKPSDDVWTAVPEVAVDKDSLGQRRIVAFNRLQKSHAAFDVLRTRLLKLCKAENWRRVAISSPLGGAGKSTISANLAFSIARNKDIRLLVVDLDLRRPMLAQILGLDGVFDLERSFRQDGDLMECVVRTNPNLAFLLNTRRVENSAELIQLPSFVSSIDAVINRLNPNIVLFDLAPILPTDDTIGFLQNTDCVIMVAAAGETRAEEIEDAERLLNAESNFIGVLLNKNREEYEMKTEYEY